MHRPCRKQHRLPPEAYIGNDRAFVITICTLHRVRVFRNIGFGHTCVALLSELHSMHGNPIYSYCLMPDHVHLLLGATEKSSISDFVCKWKSLCYRVWRESGDRSRFWQRGYYDRAIRTHEELRSVALYILNNPVRAGLVTEYQEYPLGGSFEWSL